MSVSTSEKTEFTPDDLKKLRWIEGSWRGTGGVEKPFFERYRFESDTVLAVDSFPDEKLATLTIRLVSNSRMESLPTVVPQFLDSSTLSSGNITSISPQR